MVIGNWDLHGVIVLSEQVKRFLSPLYRYVLVVISFGTIKNGTGSRISIVVVLQPLLSPEAFQHTHWPEQLEPKFQSEAFICYWPVGVSVADGVSNLFINGGMWPKPSVTFLQPDNGGRLCGLLSHSAVWDGWNPLERDSFFHSWAPLTENLAGEKR